MRRTGPGGAGATHEVVARRRSRAAALPARPSRATTRDTRPRVRANPGHFGQKREEPGKRPSSAVARGCRGSASPSTRSAKASNESLSLRHPPPLASGTLRLPRRASARCRAVAAQRRRRAASAALRAGSARQAIRLRSPAAVVCSPRQFPTRQFPACSGAAPVLRSSSHRFFLVMGPDALCAQQPVAPNSLDLGHATGEDRRWKPTASSGIGSLPVDAVQGPVPQSGSRLTGPGSAEIAAALQRRRGL